MCHDCTKDEGGMQGTSAAVLLGGVSCTGWHHNLHVCLHRPHSRHVLSCPSPKAHSSGTLLTFQIEKCFVLCCSQVLLCRALCNTRICASILHSVGQQDGLLPCRSCKLNGGLPRLSGSAASVSGSEHAGRFDVHTAFLWLCAQLD